MSFRHSALVATMAFTTMMSSAPGADEPRPKEATVGEEEARLLGQWEMSAKEDPTDPDSKVMRFQISFRKDGRGGFVRPFAEGVLAPNMNWKVIDWGGEPVIVAIGGFNEDGTVIRYQWLKDGKLLFLTGAATAGGKRTLTGEWQRVPQKDK